MRQTVSLMACFAVALHAILFGVPMMAGGAPADPFSVICHSQTSGPPAGGQAPADPNQIPSQACDHCSFCHVSAAQSAPDGVLLNTLAPAPLRHVLRPVSSVSRGYLATTPKLAQGPPLLT
jgi:hypothetical protein